MGIEDDLRQRREQVFREHCEAENRHDLDGLVASFYRPRYELVPAEEPNEGEAGVRQLWEDMWRGFPDFRIEPLKVRHAEDALIAEILCTGTHEGPWQGISATGRAVSFLTAAFFEFEEDRLVNEKVYFDMATILRQLGVGPE